MKVSSLTFTRKLNLVFLQILPPLPPASGASTALPSVSSSSPLLPRVIARKTGSRRALAHTEIVPLARPRCLASPGDRRRRLGRDAAPLRAALEPSRVPAATLGARVLPADRDGSRACM